MLDDRLPESLSYRNVQPDLELGCTGNIRRNPAFQARQRSSDFPILVRQGGNDPFFLPVGAEAFAQDVPHATVESLDTGHFVLETHCDHMAARIRAVLGQPLPEGGK